MDEEAKPVRRLSEIDLPGIAEGLGSNDDAWRWWYDPSTGETHMAPGYAHSDALDEEEWDPIGLGMMEIERGGSRRAYEDMEEFAEAVGQRRAGDLLLRAPGCVPQVPRHAGRLRRPGSAVAGVL